MYMYSTKHCHFWICTVQNIANNVYVCTVQNIANNAYVCTVQNIADHVKCTVKTLTDN